MSTAAVFALRLPAALSHPAGGIDYGHYLATYHWLIGAEPTEFGNHGLFGFHLLYVLLVPLLGEVTTTAVSGPFVVSLLLPAGYVLARRAMPPLAALACGGLLSCAQGFSEMVAWGGNPNLLAMCFSLTAWRLILDTVQAVDTGQSARRPALLAGAFVGLMLLTHFFTAFIVLVTVGAFLAVGGGIGVLSLRTLARPAAIATALAAVIALPGALQYYALLDEGALTVANPQANGFSHFEAEFGYLHRDTPLVWAGAFAAAITAVALLAKRRDTFALYLGVSFVVPVVLAFTLFSAHIARTLYFLEPPAVIGLGAALYWVWRERERVPRLLRGIRRPAIAALAVTLLLVVPPTTAYRSTAAVDFFNHVGADHLAAFVWIREHSTRDDAVWTAGSFVVDPEGRSGASYGFWIEGYARRTALYTARPETLAFAPQQAASRDASRILEGDTVAENPLFRVGMPDTPAAGLVPSIATRGGSDFVSLIYGDDLGLEGGARVYRLSGGVENATAQYAVDGETARMRTQARLTAPGTWGAHVLLETELYRSSVIYRVQVSDAAYARPWLHEDFVLSPWAVFKGNETTDGGATQTFRYTLPATTATPEQLYSFRFHARDADSKLLIVRYGAETGGTLRVSVTGRALAPALEMEARLVLEGADAQGAGGIAIFAAKEILAARGVRFLLVDVEPPELVRRFAAQPDHYVRAFETPTVLVFEWVRAS